MKKIFLFLFLLTFTIFSEKAFSLTYDKRVNTDIKRADGSTGGRSESEGFYGDTSNAPNCKKFNFNYVGLIQGQKLVYQPNGTLNEISKGLFGCMLDANNKPALGLVEGVTEIPNQDNIQIFFKNDGINRHIYSKLNGTWTYWTRNIDYAFWNHPLANTSQRLATKEEIEHAVKLYTFYKNLDLSSRSAKIYGDKIYNSNDPIAKKESTPKKYDWMNKYNDNDIIPAGSGTGFL